MKTQENQNQNTRNESNRNQTTTNETRNPGNPQIPNPNKQPSPNEQPDRKQPLIDPDPTSPEETRQDPYAGEKRNERSENQIDRENTEHGSWKENDSNRRENDMRNETDTTTRNRSTTQTDKDANRNTRD